MMPLTAAAEPGMHPWLGLLLGFFLVLLNGFFVAAEFALVKVRPTQIDPHVAAGSLRGRIARYMVTHLDAYLSATQLGITLSSLALGWIGEPAFAWLIDPLVAKIPGLGPEATHTIAFVLAFGVITILHIVLGELAPKSLAIRKAEGTTLNTALPLFWFFRLTYPAIWLLNLCANALLKIFGVEPVTEGELGHDEEELRRMLAATDDRLTEQKRTILDNVFELSHRIARQVMVPRADVVYLSSESTVEENLEVARKSGHTRFPFCQGDLDHVTGLIHIKDLFRAPQPLTDLSKMAREIPLMPETLTLDRMLRRMRREKMHMAAVLDEYGGVSGIVTFENVIEEIVGQIQDEFDAEIPELVAEGPGRYLVAGSILVEELEKALGIELSDRDEDTIAGVILSEIGRRSEPGDRVELGEVQFEVLETELNRILSLRLTVPVPEPESAPDSVS
ncbi:MAG: hemolysin family protein [Acidobacteriota bacterium]